MPLTSSLRAAAALVFAAFAVMWTAGVASPLREDPIRSSSAAVTATAVGDSAMHLVMIDLRPDDPSTSDLPLVAGVAVSVVVALVGVLAATTMASETSGVQRALSGRGPPAR